MKNWHLKPVDIDQALALERTFNLHPVIARILSMRELGDEEEIRRFLRNDLNDLAAMGMVGFPVAPFDAAEPVIRLAKFVTRARGGHGVIREMALTLFLFE